MVVQTREEQKRRTVFRRRRAGDDRKITIKGFDEEPHSTTPVHENSDDLVDISERENTSVERNPEALEHNYDITLIRRANPIYDSDLDSDSEQETNALIPQAADHWIASIFRRFFLRTDSSSFSQ